jgi:hypothetical protein
VIVGPSPRTWRLLEGDKADLLLNVKLQYVAAIIEGLVAVRRPNSLRRRSILRAKKRIRDLEKRLKWA